jgi:hypothetical protein
VLRFDPAEASRSQREDARKPTHHHDHRQKVSVLLLLLLLLSVVFPVRASDCQSSAHGNGVRPTQRARATGRSSPDIRPGRTSHGAVRPCMKPSLGMLVVLSCVVGRILPHLSLRPRFAKTLSATAMTLIAVVPQVMPFDHPWSVGRNNLSLGFRLVLLLLTTVYMVK